MECPKKYFKTTEVEFCYFYRTEVYPKGQASNPNFLLGSRRGIVGAKATFEHSRDIKLSSFNVDISLKDKQAILDDCERVAVDFIIECFPEYTRDQLYVDFTHFHKV